MNINKGFYLTLFVTIQLLNVSSGEAYEAEKYNSGWSFYFDNDLFTLGNRDNDYTGGIALKLAGTRVKSLFFSVDSLLGVVNDLTGFPALFSNKDFFTTHSMEMGFTLFTANGS